jgi:hypothetical protein
MLREKKVIRTRSQVCNKKCYFWESLFLKITITLPTLTLYYHLFQNTVRPDSRADVVNYLRILEILKLTSNCIMSTTARNLVPFHKIYHYIKMLDRQPQRRQTGAGESSYSSVFMLVTNFVASFFTVAPFLAE